MANPIEQFENAASITTHDTNDLDPPRQSIYIGGDGNIKVDMYGTGTVTFNGVKAGTFLPVLVSRVYATGTTATNIIGGWE